VEPKPYRWHHEKIEKQHSQHEVTGADLTYPPRARGIAFAGDKPVHWQLPSGKLRGCLFFILKFELGDFYKKRTATASPED